MMTIAKRSWMGRALAAVLVAWQAFTGYVLAAAQDPNVKIDINADLDGGGGAFYTTWWFWVLIGLFVLIVIVALTTRGRAARE